MPKTISYENGFTVMPTDLPLLIDPATAAKLSTTSEAHIRVLCAKGEIKAVKSGAAWRINRDAFLEQMGLA